MSLTEEQLTHLRIQSEYGLSPHKTQTLLQYVDELRARNETLSREYRIADNLVGQLRVPLDALRGLAADYGRGGLSDAEFVAAVHYWVDA